MPRTEMDPSLLPVSSDSSAAGLDTAGLLGFLWAIERAERALTWQGEALEERCEPVGAKEADAARRAVGVLRWRILRSCYNEARFLRRCSNCDDLLPPTHSSGDQYCNADCKTKGESDMPTWRARQLQDEYRAQRRMSAEPDRTEDPALTTERAAFVARREKRRIESRTAFREGTGSRVSRALLLPSGALREIYADHNEQRLAEWASRERGYA